MRSRISLFILIGLFLFIIDYRFSYDEDLNQIIIPDDEILGLIDTWRDQVGRDPSDEEIVRIINNLVNEEILYREALKLELDNVFYDPDIEHGDFLSYEIKSVFDSSDREIKKPNWFKFD